MKIKSQKDSDKFSKNTELQNSLEGCRRGEYKDNNKSGDTKKKNAESMREFMPS